MKTPILIAAFLALSAAALGDGPNPANPPASPPKVTVAARGDDVRSVIHQMFQQAGRDYVLEPGVRFVLYLSLKDVELEEALEIVCRQANLEYRVQNGITFIGPKKQLLPEKPSVPKPEERPLPTAAPKEPEPTGTLPPTVLSRRFTTRMSKAPIRDVFKAIAEQTKVRIEVADSVPNWKMDAFLIDTSIKYALDLICRQTGLEFRFTNRQSIEIRKPDPTPKEENRVTVFRD
ncbi:MAG: STN domain-containing protein [Fimbriimonadales bacterium]|nr:STN domain-containing protein [Fimbriimonadales bacterium]